MRRRVKGISARKEVVFNERNRRVTKCFLLDIIAIGGVSQQRICKLLDSLIYTWKNIFSKVEI